MKVLFLDVDGVLNHYGSIALLAISDPKLRLLEKIVNESGCKIVVSSTWRKLPETRRVLMKRLGYRNLRVYDWTTTKYWKIGQVRGDEIQAWLDEHPNVTNYVIVDDDADMLPHQMSRFVKTNGHDGLTNDDVDTILELFNQGD